MKKGVIIMTVAKALRKVLRESDKNTVTPLITFDNGHIYVNGETLRSKEVITDSEFLDIMNKALEQSKLIGVIRGKYVTLFKKPCRDFLKIQNLLWKYGGVMVHPWDIYLSICSGNPDYHIDVGEREYLCYIPDRCGEIVSEIRGNKLTRHNLSVKLKELCNTKLEVVTSSQVWFKRGIAVVDIVTSKTGKVLHTVEVSTLPSTKLSTYDICYQI